MHRYRRQAKYAAWYDDPDDARSNIPIKNPFRKYRAPSKSNANDPVNDAENGELRHTVTDQDYDEENRRSQLIGTPPKHHANTVPDARSNVDKGQAQFVDDIPRSASPDHDEIQEDQKLPHWSPNAKGSGDTSETAREEITEKDESQDDGVRHRNSEKHGFGDKLKGVMHHKKDGEEQSPEVTDGDNKEKKPKQTFTVMGQIRATLLNSWINILLICSPVGIALHYAGVKPAAVFVVNFVAIIPLAAMLSYATEEIALRTGEVIGGLINASFGNAVELIVSVIALAQDQIIIVQTSLIGSMLSNLLLVMGMCFFFGGFNRIEQEFNMTVAQTASSLLFLAISALIIPTAFENFSSGTETTSSSGVQSKPGTTETSRGTAVLLLVVYGCYLFFQLKSHTKMYNAPSKKNEKRDLKKHTRKFKARTRKAIPQKFRGSNESGRSSPDSNAPAEEKEEVPQLSLTCAIVTLCASTVLVALNADYLVDSINEITCESNISKNFIGLILLPIVGNAAEHATAVTVAVKDKMDLAIGVAVGSSMQIALLVLPFVVVLGWIIGKNDMTLNFDGFQVVVLFVAILLVNYLIQDGKSHWLEGVLLMTLYIIIATAAWFYPPDPGSSDCPASSGTASKRAIEFLFDKMFYK